MLQVLKYERRFFLDLFVNLFVVVPHLDRPEEIPEELLVVIVLLAKLVHLLVDLSEVA